VAGWCRYLRGYDRQGDPIDIKDARKDVLQALAVARGTDPRPLLGERDIFGRLGDDPEFVRTLEAAIRDIEEYGPAAIIAEHLSNNLCPPLRPSHADAAPRHPSSGRQGLARARG
jgi:fructuronate reductase/mannitol 2-dehydrogenase